MPEPTSPRAVFERLIDGISAGRWHELATLYAEEAVVGPRERPRPNGLTRSMMWRASGPREDTHPDQAELSA